MALPIILGIGAALAAAGGIGAGIKGAVDTKDAHDTMESARRRNEKNLAEFKSAEATTKAKMECLGKLEMTTASDFKRFLNAHERIKNNPTKFDPLKENEEIPSFDFNEIQLMSVAAGAFLGAAAGGTTGALFGTAAATGTTAAVMALGTASTGTAIASLSGAAATKAALAAIGGGSIAAGGGGIALGTTLLGASTLGVGLLVGGAIFAFTGSKIKDKADEAYAAMLKNEHEINKSLAYFRRICPAADNLTAAIRKISYIYERKVRQLIELVERENDWHKYSGDERLLYRNTAQIVGVLFKLINTPLLKVTKTDNQGEVLETDVDAESVEKAINIADCELSKIGVE